MSMTADVRAGDDVAPLTIRGRPRYSSMESFGIVLGRHNQGSAAKQSQDRHGQETIDRTQYQG